MSCIKINGENTDNMDIEKEKKQIVKMSNIKKERKIMKNPQKEKRRKKSEFIVKEKRNKKSMTKSKYHKTFVCALCKKPGYARNTHKEYLFSTNKNSK